MKFSHYWTLVIIGCIVGAAVASILEGNWGELGMCITAFGGWMIVAKYEYDERKANEALSG
jgi:uncharacterized membrane protein YoaK (UPF0700 family)